MRLTTQRMKVASLLVFAIAAFAISSAAADTIYPASGKPIGNVEIIRANWDRIAYELLGAQSTIEGYKVLRIERDSPLNKVEERIQSGKYKAALKGLNQATKRGLSNDLDKAKAAFLKGKLYLAWSSSDPSKASAAISAFKSYLKEFEGSKDFYVPHAHYELGRAYLKAKNHSEADKQFRTLDKYGSKDGIWGYKGINGTAWAELLGGTRDASLRARKAFGVVERDNKAPKSARSEARVGRAACFVTVKDYGKARAEIEREFLKKKPDYDEYYARACNVMGDAYRLEGGKENLQQAEIWYLKTTCLFSQYPDVYREAVRNLVSVYDKLGDSKKAEDWKKRLK